jgi:hypothetical protein
MSPDVSSGAHRLLLPGSCRKSPARFTKIQRINEQGKRAGAGLSKRAMAARDGFDLRACRIGINVLGEVHPPLVKAARQRAVGAMAAEHAHHGVADLPWAVALDDAFHHLHAQVRVPQVPEEIEVHETARMRETLGHDVHVARWQADEERGGDAEQVGHG